MKKLLTSKLEGCPVAIFDDRYKHIRKENFKNKHGIYALYDKNGKLYYVGRASDLSGRMNQHLKHNRHSKKWEYFSVYFTATRDEAYALEAIILSICPPKGNRKNAEVSKVAKDTEMRRRIEKQINDTDKNRMQFRVPGIPAKNKKGNGDKADQYIRKTVSQGSTQKRKLRLKDLFSNGFLRGPQTLKAKYKTKTFFATLLPSGEIEYQGKKYLTPSRVAMVAKKSKSENGWTVWKIQNSSNKWITLDELGQRLQKKEGNSDKGYEHQFKLSG